MCQRTKPHRHCVYSAVTSLLISIKQFSEISMNFMMNLSSSTLDDHVYDTVLMIVDWYIKIVKYLFIIKSVDVCSLTNFTYHYIFLIFD